MSVTWEPGCAEDWIGNILQALLRAFQRTNLRVLETGGFVGYTSAKLAEALTDEDELIVCDIDPTRAQAIQEALDGRGRCHTTVIADDVMKWIAQQPDESLDFAFVDDDHTAQHVHDEIVALLPKVRPGGLLTFHDVWGSCDLQAVLQAFPNTLSLDFPRLGPAGGLGIMQVR